MVLAMSIGMPSLPSGIWVAICASASGPPSASIAGCQNVAGLDAVHGDVLARVLERRRADQPVEAALRGRVVRGARHGDIRSGHRRGEQKAAAALLAQDAAEILE